MPGILYVVATPIGNLEDVTFRALRVLREVSIIAAEDTRRTARLLQHYSIPTPTTSLHEHNEYVKTAGLLERLARGESVALVSDAGTPAISDPGARVVAAAHHAGIKVEPIPGPSAVTAALAASGVVSDGFVFAGFPPSRSKARKEWLSLWATEPRAVVFFEAPHRILALLTEALDVLGDRTLTIARELTKAHENLVTSQISSHLAAGVREQGEFTLVLHPPDNREQHVMELPDATALADEFGQLTNNGVATRRQALQALATKYKVPAREVYRILEGRGK